MNDPKTCAVLVPVASAIEPETNDALSRLADSGYHVQMLRGCSQVDLARSALASWALGKEFAETMWIDSDVVFNPADVEKLRGHNLPLTAALYVKKGKPEFAGKFLANTRGAQFGKGGGLLEMEYVGMGFTHIRAEVYAKVRQESNLPACHGGYDPTKPVVPYFLPMIVPEGKGHCYLSEDYSLCYRARQAGFRIVADTSIKLGHAGRKVHTWDDLVPSQRLDSFQAGVA
jgi:hypothetical protein